MLRITCVLLGCLAVPVHAGTYEDLILEAHRIQREVVPGEPEEARLEAAYAKLAEAAQHAPRRWEAFFERGLNRCQIVQLFRRKLAADLDTQRSLGTNPEIIQQRQAGGMRMIQMNLQQAHRDFTLMERRMVQRGELDRNFVDLANAMMKFAKGEFERTESGEHGAIEDLKRLLKRRWRVPEMAFHIAACYDALAANEFARERFPEAQEHWDTALRFAQNPAQRRRILTNKAGAFEMDNEFGLATEILRDQIRREPHRPGHWKNLGLLLGYQNELREAAYCYAQARDLCMHDDRPTTLAVWHGNAWLKAAMIHGKLLEEDGDLLEAWRLFLAYRELFGDDYNFCLNFADFAFTLGAYDVAWTFAERARDLQPFCTQAYQLLVSMAPRTKGTPEELRARQKQAEEALSEAREKFHPRLVATSLKRLCGGVQDVGDADSEVAGRRTRMDPDPLAGFGPDRVPEWIRAAAAERKPYQPFVPKPEDAAPPADPAPADPDAEAGVEVHTLTLPLWIPLGLGALLLGAIVVLLGKRRAA